MNNMGQDLSDQEKVRYFESIALPYLDVAYNLARWLTRDDYDAEDLVQNAYLRAFRFIDSYRGDNARAWLLTIVRNTYFTSLRDDRAKNEGLDFDEELHSHEDVEQSVSYTGVGIDPETALLQLDSKNQLNRALENLPVVYREVVILKELDDLSYKEIAEITNTPIGTVMSRLARGRKLLFEQVKKDCNEQYTK